MISHNSAIHCNTTNHCNHSVAEYDGSNAWHSTLHLQSVKKLSKSDKRMPRYRLLNFWPSLGGAFHLLNQFLILQVIFNVERWLMCLLYHFQGWRVQKWLFLILKSYILAVICHFQVLGRALKVPKIPCGNRDTKKHNFCAIVPYIYLLQMLHLMTVLSLMFCYFAKLAP